MIFQDLNDLIEAVRAENPDIQQFECSVFQRRQRPKDVDQGYLDFLDTLRNDDAKAVQRQNEVENLEMPWKDDAFARVPVWHPDFKLPAEILQVCLQV